MAARQSLRTWLQAHDYPYVLAVACNEPVGIVTPDGRRRRVEVGEVEALGLHEQDWQRLSMSEGTKGPRLFDWAAVPMLYQWEDDGRHWLLLRRSLTDPNEKAYYFVFAPPGTTLQNMVAAIGARWHIEEDAGKRQRSGAGPLRSSLLQRVVPTHHAGAGGSCLLDRDVCHGALLPLCSCSLSASRSTCRAAAFCPSSAPSGDSSQDLTPLAHSSRVPLGGPPKRCTPHMCRRGAPPGAGHTAWSPLSALAPLLMPKSDAASAFAAAHLNPLPAPEGEPAQQAAVLCAPSASLADLLQQLSQLHLQLATLQHRLTGLTLAVLHERTALDEDLLQQRLRPRAGSVPQSHESLLASSQADGTGLLVPSPLPAPRPLPAEVRARSRVTALIEYGAHGQYVAVCPKLGVLSLTPDSPQWFDWLASLTSFRGCRAQPGALRRVVPPPTGSTPAVGLPGACFMGTTAGTILGSPTVSHAPLWNRRRLSFKLGWTRSE